MKALLFALCCTFAASAAAQDAPVEQEKKAEIWASFDLYSGQRPTWTATPGATDATTLAMMVGGGYRFVREVAVRLVWPMLFAVGNGPGPYHDSGLDTANPFLGVYWLPRIRDVRFELGGGAAIPIAPNRSDLDVRGLELAAASHGNADFWLWYPSHLSLVTSMHIENERPVAGVLVFAGDLALAGMIPVGDATRADLVIQPGFSIAAKFARYFSAGLRFIVAIIPTVPSGVDAAQASLTPFFRGDFDAGFFDLSLIVNLDNVWGFAFDQGRVWGLRLMGGVRF